MSDIDESWLRWPEKCSATIAKGPRFNKEEQPCDKPAVAVALYNGDEFEPHAYPVCKHHARGRPMYSLLDVILAAQKSVLKRSVASPSGVTGTRPSLETSSWYNESSGRTP